MISVDKPSKNGSYLLHSIIELKAKQEQNKSKTISKTKKEGSDCPLQIVKKVTKFKILVVRKVDKNERPKNELLSKCQEPCDYVKNCESDCTEISPGID